MTSHPQEEMDLSVVHVPSRRKNVLVSAGLSVVLTLAGILGFAAPAAADITVTKYTGICEIDGWPVRVSMWVKVNTNNIGVRYSIDRLTWTTNDSGRVFTPSRLAVGWKSADGTTPLVRAWGGSAATLHDVAATGDTGPNWQQDYAPQLLFQGFFATIYLNGNGKQCPTPTMG